MAHHNDDEVMRDILENSHLWFVVGLSDNTERDAYRIAQLLSSKGKHVVGIHPQGDFPTLAEAAAEHGPPDVVDFFVRSERVAPLVAEAIEIGAGAVWLQLGVVDEDAVEHAAQQGLHTVMDTCPAIQWPRLMGS